MKSKGISIWEQHLEHFVLGIAVLVFIGFTALQFVGNPNAVESSGKTFTPGNVDDILTEEAESLVGRLRPDAPPTIEVPDPDLALNDFQAHLTSPSLPTRPLPMVAVQLPFQDVKGVAGGDVRFYVPQVPAPTDVVTAQYSDALIESAILAVDELKERFHEPPFDVTWITIAATMDVDKVLEEFRKSDPQNSLESIPEAWYNGVKVLDVRFEREERRTSEDPWTNRRTLDVLPGQFSLRALLKGNVDAAGRDAILGALTQPGAQQQIVEPEFYETRNEIWSPPEPGDDVADEGLSEEDSEEAQIRTIRKQLERQVRDRDRLAETLDQAGGPLEDKPKGPGGDDDRRPGGERGGGRGAPGGQPPGGGIGAGGGGGAGAGAGGGTSDRNKKQRIALTKRLSSYDKRIEVLQNKLNQLVGLPPELADAPQPELDQPERDFMTGRIRVWAHDMSVEPGVSYRYRLKVEVFNPFFARKINLVEDQHGLAEKLTLESQDSSWSKPRTARPPLRVFVTGATAGGTGGLIRGSGGQAQIEIYRFSHGRWWRDSQTVFAGDRIGGLKTMARREDDDAFIPDQIDFGTGWYVLDIVHEAGSRGAQDKGRQAVVILQSLTDPSQIRVHDPRREWRDSDRLDLKEQVDLAGLSGGLADAG